MPRLELITENQYRNYNINNNHGALVRQWLDKVIDLSLFALDEHYEPVGYVISFELAPERTIKQFQENLTYYYQDSSARTTTPCKPLWITKYEIKQLTYQSPEFHNVDDPSKHYEHYHMALILDAKKCRDKSLSYFLALSQEKELIGQYLLSKNKYNDSFNKSLKTSFNEWIYHASYPTKLETTADVRKPFNTVRFTNQKPKETKNEKQPCTTTETIRSISA